MSYRSLNNGETQYLSISLRRQDKSDNWQVKLIDKNGPYGKRMNYRFYLYTGSYTVTDHNNNEDILLWGNNQIIHNHRPDIPEVLAVFSETIDNTVTLIIYRSRFFVTSVKVAICIYFTLQMTWLKIECKTM